MVLGTAHRVARLMRLNHLRSRKQRKFKATTNSKHAYPVASNLLRQNFSASRANTIWVADISYIPTQEGWLYLAGYQGYVYSEDRRLVNGQDHDQKVGYGCFTNGLDQAET